MTTAQRLDQHDKQIAAIRKLMATGMRLVAQNEMAIARTQKQLGELAAAQKKTEASLKAFIDGMRGRGNGHTRRKLDV